MNQRKYILDFRNVRHYLEMHSVIRKSLDFPDYYGCNWDAFWDCLTDWDALADMRGNTIQIEITGLDVVKRKFDGAADKMISILREYKHYIKKYGFNIDISTIQGNMRVRID